MSQKSSGGAGHPDTPATTIHTAAARPPQDRPQRSAELGLPIVFGTRFLAAGAAAYDWVVVRSCCYCGFAHRHTWFERSAEAIERAPSCRPHASYQVRVSDVVPAAGVRRAVA